MTAETRRLAVVFIIDELVNKLMKSHTHQHNHPSRLEPGVVLPLQQFQTLFFLFIFVPLLNSLSVTHIPALLYLLIFMTVSLLLETQPVLQHQQHRLAEVINKEKYFVLWDISLS